MEIRPLESRDRDALEDFLRRIPEGDRTFFKEAAEDAVVVDSWVQDPAGRRLPEALLTGQVRDRSGELLDLMILAHTASDAAAAAAAAGLADA